jgi:hypothetical protein
MRLYEIIYPYPPPKGSLGPAIFLNFFYQDFDVRSGVSYFIQEKVFGPSKT